MTDEMIQQIPQQRGSYGVPGLITGAAIGGVGGYAAAANTNFAYKSKPDLDKVFAQAPDYFEAQGKNGDAAKWSDAGKIVKGIQDLEAKYDAKAEELKKNGSVNNIAELADTEQTKKDYNKAKAAYDRALEAKKTEISRTSSASVAGEIPSRKALSEHLTSTEFKEFEPYLNDYENAKRRLTGGAGKKFAGGSARPAYNNIYTELTAVDDFYTNIYDKNYKSLTQKQKDNFDPTKGKVRRKLQSRVDSMLPEKYGASLTRSARTYNDFIKYQEMFGSDLFEMVTEKPDSVPGKGIFKVTDKKGKNVWFLVDNEGIKSKREALFNEFAENVTKYNEFAVKAQEFDKEFFEANKDALKNDLFKPITKASDLSKLPQPKEFNKALRGLEVIETGLNNKSLSYPQTIGAHVINNADELQVYKMRVQAGKELSEKHAIALGELKKESQAILETDPKVKYARSEFKKVINEDPGVKNAVERMEKRLNGKFSTERQKELYAKVKELIGEKPEGLTDAEIEQKAIEALDGKKVATDLKTAEEKALARCKELGKAGEMTEEELKKAMEKAGFKSSKEEFIKASKDEAKTKLETLLKDLKVNNKWATAGIAAAILAIAGLGIGASMKKDA